MIYSTEITIGLLAIIALSELSRLFLTHKKATKKSHFKQRYESTQRMIWDLDFKVFKTKEIREDVRREYDNKKTKLDAVNEKIKTHDRKDMGEFNRLGDQVVLLERDLKRHEEQMKQLDIEVNGTKPTNEYPEGIQGTLGQIESLREVQLMVRDWIKNG